MHKKAPRIVTLRPTAGLVLAGLVMAAGMSSPSAAAAPSRLAGLTTVTGSTSARSTVVLDRPATVTITGVSSTAVTITGGGRYAGIKLTRRSSGPSISLEAMNVNFCNTPGCKPDQAKEYVDAIAPSRTHADGSRTVTLGAGTYDLQLVADGAPVSVALKLGGLKGASRLTPHGRSNFAILDMTPTAGVSMGPAYSAGTTRRLDSGGSVIAALVADRTASAGRQSGLCAYRGSPPPAGLYTEQCPGAFAGVQLLIPEGLAVDDTVREYGGVLGLPADQWSIGQYEMTAGIANVRFANALWLQP
jgi:hypothetical protein